MKAFAPGWLAYDMRLMMHRYQQDGAAATPAEIASLTNHLDQPPLSCLGFATGTARQWQTARSTLSQPPT